LESGPKIVISYKSEDRNRKLCFYFLFLFLAACKTKEITDVFMFICNFLAGDFLHCPAKAVHVTESQPSPFLFLSGRRDELTWRHPGVIISAPSSTSFCSGLQADPLVAAFEGGVHGDVVVVPATTKKKKKMMMMMKKKQANGVCHQSLRVSILSLSLSKNEEKRSRSTEQLRGNRLLLREPLPLALLRRREERFQLPSRRRLRRGRPPLARSGFSATIGDD